MRKIKFHHTTRLDDRSSIPGNHPLKLFIDSHPHSSSYSPSSSHHEHESCCRACFFLNSHRHPILDRKKFNPIQLHSHSLHLQHHRLNSATHFIPEPQLASSPSSVTLNNYPKHSFDPSPHLPNSWWLCSSKPTESDNPSCIPPKPLKGYKLRLKDDRNQSFQNFTGQLSKLLQPTHPSPSSPSPLKLLDAKLKNILNDDNLQRDFKIIWAELSSIEQTSTDNHVQFKVIELQRKSIQVLLNTVISAASTPSTPAKDSLELPAEPQDLDARMSIFNQVVDFLIFTNPPQHPNRVVSILGLDPLEGWRNLVKQHLRIQTLKTLVSFINLFNPNLSSWWTSELTQAQDVPSKLNRLAQLGIFLISALSKQGSVWKAFQLFWMMDKLPNTHPAPTPDTWELLQPISHPRRATVALGLADALISRKKIDYADQVLEAVSVGEWVGGPIYRRSLLSMLAVKGAQAEVASVEKLGVAYERVWADSNDSHGAAAGRNKRARGFHAQDPRIPVARAKIEALGILGETRSAMETFQATLSTVPSKYEAPSQLPDLYAEIMRVHLKADDPGAIKRLLTKMATASDAYGVNQPDQRHYNMLLQAYAARADVEGCSSVLDQLLAAGVACDVYTYGNISLLFANLGEPEFVREVIEALAQSDKPHRSIRPTRELWNILLDAYVESGDWSRAAKLVEYLERDDQRTQQVDVVTNGSVLKALVVSGCPTDRVLETFKSMYNLRTGLAADAKSVNLLLLSLCDGGVMDLAEAMFYGLPRGNAAWDAIKPNVYTYGIMISAFLRMGKPDSAQRYLREMRRSGIRPNLVIYSMLTTAYAASQSSGMKPHSWDERDGGVEEEEEMPQDGTWVAYEMASRFRRELLDNEAHLKGREKPDLDRHVADQQLTWGELPIIRKRLSHRLLGPIIQSYAKSARPAKALEMLRELVASLGSDYNTIGGDGKPIDIDILTMLMDAYRRAHDPVGVMEVWKEIFRIATQKNESLVASEELLNKVLGLIETHGRHEPGREQQTGVKDRGPRDAQRRGRLANTLCLPLSIYTDCLSRHGYHEEVATSWQQVQESGFAFDAPNWNELCAAMFRSGNHRMGWWITERVFFTPEAESDPVLVEDEECHGDQALRWARALHQTVGSRAVRPAPGLEGTRLDGATKVESPLRPPNRTSVRRTQRLDDEPAVRRAFRALLPARPPAPGHRDTADCPQDAPRSSWSHQLLDISRRRRELVWTPYDQVVRMLHGSLWRECSEAVVSKWNEIKTTETEIETKTETTETSETSETSETASTGQPVDSDHWVYHLLRPPAQRVIDTYQSRYPATLRRVLGINDSLDSADKHPADKHPLDKDSVRHRKMDFVRRVVGRTVERYSFLE